MNEDTPETILTKVAVILEKQSEVLQLTRQEVQQLLTKTAEMEQRLDKLESGDSINSDDAKFFKDVTNRLKVISTALETNK